MADLRSYPHDRTVPAAPPPPAGTAPESASPLRGIRPAGSSGPTAATDRIDATAAELSEASAERCEAQGRRFRPAGGAKRRGKREHGRPGELMAAVVWFTMGVALWHFTVFVPDRFWGGIVGALLASAAGAMVTGAIAQVASGRASATRTSAPRWSRSRAS